MVSSKINELNVIQNIERLIDENPQLQKMIETIENNIPSFIDTDHPKIKEAIRQTSDAFELIFVPRIIFRQIILSVALETGAMATRQLFMIVKAVLSNFSSRSCLIRQLRLKQQSSESQDEWMEIAEQIDSVQGNDVWRGDPSCPLYESDRVSERIDELVHLMRRRDIFDLMFTLRGGIARNKFGLLHEGLFSKALAGSKVLVETYHNVVCAALDFVCDAPVKENEELIPTEFRLAFFNETRHSYGRTALLLSGGAALGFFHVGVVKALMENGLLPRVLSGASAGSIVCAMIGTRTNEECIRDLFNAIGTDAPGHYGCIKIDFFRPLGYTSKNNEESKDAGAFKDAKKTFQIYMPIGVRQITSKIYDIFTGRSRPRDLLMSDTEHFRQCCKVNIGDFTFQEAFDRTGRILNITVSPQNRSDPPRLLNYLTAPHVLVWSAAVASSSLPGVFEANKLLVKNSDGSIRYESASGMRFLDGSMEADLPMQQLSEMFNINHFIISQANPHAVMFSSLGLGELTVWTNPIIGNLQGILFFLKNQIKAWAINIVQLVGGRRIAPLWDTKRSFVSQFFTQEYEGRDSDITFNPWAGSFSLFSAFLHLIYNPSEKDFRQFIRDAERQTWQIIPKIKSHIAEEITLDQCVQRLRKQMVQESWEMKRQQGLLHSYNTLNDEQTSTKTETTHEKMGKRVPSFFTSPSLVRMSGLGVQDRHELTPNEIKFPCYNKHSDPGKQRRNSREIDHINLGWGGMGLKGNRSLGSLSRADSMGSGLFIDSMGKEQSGSVSSLFRDRSPSGVFMDDSDNEGDILGELPRSTEYLFNHNLPGNFSPGDNDLNGVGQQTNTEKINDLSGTPRDYLKTTSMASFYYRNQSKSHNNLTAFDSFSAGGEKVSSNTYSRGWKSSLDLSEHGRRKT